VRKPTEYAACHGGVSCVLLHIMLSFNEVVSLS
jgi:hypothetical protein